MRLQGTHAARAAAYMFGFQQELYQDHTVSLVFLDAKGELFSSHDSLVSCEQSSEEPRLSVRARTAQCPGHCTGRAIINIE